ncbi:TPA: site-specific integrase [Bacillus cereus]|nr:site-specific integrase [Bacillus cereus]
MKKLNIQEYTTKTGKKGYILKGAYIGVDSLTGKQKRTTIKGSTKKEVKLKLERMLIEFKRNGNTAKRESDKIFDEFALEWFDRHKLTLKANTIEFTDNILHHYLIPQFKGIKISKITSAMIQEAIYLWQANANQSLNGKKRRKRGHSAKIYDFVRTLKTIFKHAVTSGIIENNPCDKVIIPKIKLESTDKEIKYFTKEELNTFFDYMETLPKGVFKNEYMLALTHLLAFGGLRVGEAMALYWSDFDFEAGTVSISKNTKNSTIQDSTKTEKGTRVILLDPNTTQKLKHWEMVCKRAMLKIGNSAQPLVFPQVKGGVQDYKGLYYQLRKHFKGAKLPDISFHGFRHTHASLLFSAGVSPKEAQDRLGHANIATTLNIYTHVSKENKVNALDKLEKYLYA